MQGGWLEQFYRRVVRAASKAEAEAAARPRRRRATCPGGRSSRAAWPRASRPAWPPARMLAQTQVAQAQAAGDTPIGPKWWPSRWGPQDEAGASNWITPAKVLEAAKLIKTGKIYELGRVYEAGMPLFGSRVFALRIPGTPTGGPFGKNKLVLPRRVRRHARSARSGPSSTGSATSAASRARTAT